MLNMNKLLVLAAFVLILASCSQQRYGFRKTIPAHRDIARTETHKPSVKEEIIPESYQDESLPADTLTTAQAEALGTIREKKPVKEIASAGIATFKEIIPFHVEQLSPEGQHRDHHTARPVDNGIPLMPLLAFIFALLSVFMLLLVIFVSSYTIGIILLFAAPVFAALGLILGMTSLSDNNGRDLAMAAVIISGMVLLIMLIVLMVSYLFLQSRNK